MAPSHHDLDWTRDLMHGVIELVEANRDAIEASRYDITIKPDGSPVTASDILVESLIRDYLERLIPGVAFAGEESFDAANPSVTEGFHAILDPIDGTENFCSGLKEWGVSFTLWRGSTHLGSMLLLPELGEHLMTGDTLKPVRSRIRGFSSSMCDEILEGMGDLRNVYAADAVSKAGFVAYAGVGG
jgi:myo-inositol-1(or 4)-monophosphatase